MADKTPEKPADPSLGPPPSDHPLFDLSRWRAATPEEDAARDFETIPDMWTSDVKLSPFRLYTYLKTRFGPCRDRQIAYRNAGLSGNFFTWSFTITPDGETLFSIFANNSGVTFRIRSAREEWTDAEKDWLQAAMKADAGKLGAAMGPVRGDFVEWELHINPYHRNSVIVEAASARLRALDLSEPPALDSRRLPDEAEVEAYAHTIENWQMRVWQGIELGHTVRTLAPIMCESYLNLVFFVFMNDEHRNDPAKAKEFLKGKESGIIQRITKLSSVCRYIDHSISVNDKPVQDFLNMYNGRNDRLHGNVMLNDPHGSVWFDGNVPLFETEEPVIHRFTRGFACGVDRDASLKDRDVACGFVAYLLDKVGPTEREGFSVLMNSHEFGWNTSKKRLTLPIGLPFGPGEVETFLRRPRPAPTER